MNQNNRAILEKYRPLILPVRDQQLEVKTAQSFLQSMPDQEVRDNIVMDDEAGNFFMVPCPLRPSQVYECIVGAIGKDSMICVYNATSIFNSKSDLIKCRTELMNAIRAHYTAESDKGMVVEDANRQRFVLLKEMATAQLFDVLEKLTLPSGDPMRLDKPTLH